MPIQNQCPQFNIFILTSIVGSLVLLSLKSPEREALFVNRIISFFIGLSFLVGTGYCKWPWQWLTWALALSSIISAFYEVLYVSMIPDDKIITFYTEIE